MSRTHPRPQLPAFHPRTRVVYPCAVAVTPDFPTLRASMGTSLAVRQNIEAPARKQTRAAFSDAIEANSILSKLRVDAKQALIDGATLHPIEKGATICHQAAPSIRFWLVLRGEVKLLKYTTKGAALLLDIVLPNQLFGTVIYQQNPVYACTAEAVRPTELLSFRLRDLLDDLENNSSLQKALLAETSHKLWHANQMRGLWREEARVRIAHQLLALSEKFGPVIPQTRATIAELAGTTVETAIRISNAFARHGVLATRRGRIEILCPASLQALAEGRDLINLRSMR